MIKFGILKSKIEKVLLESYSNNTFKDELKNFKKLVLENKNISKIFYLYDELSSKKGLNENTVNDYIHECITMYENSINKIKSSDLNNLKSWVNNVKSKNLYETVDGLFSTDVLTIESKIKSKKLIKESLMSVAPINKEVIQLPLTTMVNVANKTITAYIDDLNESEKKDLMKFLSTDDSVLKEGALVLVVDDVLNSGRTLVYGLGYFLNIPLKKIRTVVLVDRSHRRFPVAPDYTGLQLATVLKEHVLVVLDSPGEEDAVYLT
jgi:pyrimidine operon attenuation protein/uracil phosphoribosyltransferase